jgi:hypothetical protein
MVFFTLIDVLQSFYRGEAVKNIFTGMLLCFLVLAWAVGLASAADDAQAALTSRDSQPTEWRYVIPDSLSAEEKRWFKAFQEGNFFSEGWQDITAEILAKTPPEQRPIRKIALENLGSKIAMEWCRTNAVRKVDSSMLQEWGDVLRSAARKNPAKLPQAIAYIDQEVDAVLD